MSCGTVRDDKSLVSMSNEVISLSSTQMMSFMHGLDFEEKIFCIYVKFFTHIFNVLQEGVMP